MLGLRLKPDIPYICKIYIKKHPFLTAHISDEYHEENVMSRHDGIIILRSKLNFFYNIKLFCQCRQFQFQFLSNTCELIKRCKEVPGAIVLDFFVSTLTTVFQQTEQMTNVHKMLGIICDLKILQRKRTTDDVLLEMYYICCFLNNQFDNKDQKSTGILISSENVTIGLNLENVQCL